MRKRLRKKIERSTREWTSPRYRIEYPFPPMKSNVLLPHIDFSQAIRRGGSGFFADRLNPDADGGSLFNSVHSLK